MMNARNRTGSLAVLLLTSMASAQGREPVERVEPGAAPAAEEETFRVEVAFATVDAATKEPVVGIELEIGVGIPTSWSVLDRGSDLDNGIVRPTLARAVSDEAGLARVAVDVPVTWRGDDLARMWARVASSGFQEATGWRRFDERRAGEPTNVFVRAGATLRGVVCGADGTPIIGADVFVAREEENAWKLADRSRSRGAGRFELSYPSSGSYVVHARAPEPGPQGSVRLALELETNAPHEPLELVVGGGVHLSGVVRDPAGDPVPAATVTAVPIGASAKDIDTLRKVERAGGVLGASVRADARGRFAFASLVPFGYELVASWLPYDRISEERGPAFVSSAPVRVRLRDEMQDVELVLASHRLEVRAKDAMGGVPDSLIDGARALFLGPLEVEPAQDAGWNLPEQLFLAEGVAVVPLEPSVDYLLSWTEPGVPYFDCPVHIERDQWCLKKAIRLGERSRSTTLTLRITGPDGEVWKHDANVEVRSVGSGRLVRRSSDRPWLGFDANPVRDGSWTAELAPGEYRIHVDADPLDGCVVSKPRPRATVAGSTFRVTLAGEASKTARVALRRAGYLQFESLTAPDGPTKAEEPYFLERFPGGGGVLHEREARQPLGGGYASLRAPTGEPFEGFRFEVDDWDLDWILPGWDAICDTALPVGTWTLSVVGDGQLLWEDEVVIEEGQTTVVRW